MIDQVLFTKTYNNVFQILGGVSSYNDDNILINIFADEWKQRGDQKTVIDSLASQHASKMFSGLQWSKNVISNSYYLSTGCPRLDDKLGGGEKNQKLFCF